LLEKYEHFTRLFGNTLTGIVMIPNTRNARGLRRMLMCGTIKRWKGVTSKIGL